MGGPAGFLVPVVSGWRRRSCTLYICFYRGRWAPSYLDVKLGITDHIDCAHFLPGHHKCGKLHGHTYKVEIIIEGDTGAGGMLLDFDLMKQHLQSVLSRYDHTSLNDFLDYPSVENICELLRTELAEKFTFSFTVRVWEGEGKWAEL